MNSKSLRRLAGDHGSLHTSGLPPNYLFPPDTDASADLTTLDVLLCGPVGTPYAHGVWRLHLDIPPTYPTAAPTAFFRTRCWHPNVDEATGAVCVETLKRDWSSALKLRDVLVTISCLLIQPNPASALNEEAGKLANEDWAGYCRRAKLMTEIHAAVPTGLANDVREAQMRGEDTATDMAHKNSKQDVQSKGKERVKFAPSTSSKAQRAPLIEDEENIQHRGRTAPSDSEESDWIPRPAMSSHEFRSSEHGENVFGVRGLKSNISLEDPSKHIPVDPRTGELVASKMDHTDLLATAASRHTTHPQTSVIIPLSPTIVTSQHDTNGSSESLKHPYEDLVLAIQPASQLNPLLKEFSYTWRNSGVQHKNGLCTENSDSRDTKLKRSAEDEFERRRKWELKRFKKAGCDLKRYNRGDFGPRTETGRL